MNAPHETLREVRRWVAKAENDLANAKNTLKMKKNCPFDTICFHAQQCAEKYLKALLVYESIEFPKTHDVRALLHLVPAWSQLALETKEAVKLNRYAVESRYPDDWDEFTRAEAEKAVDVALKVRKAVRDKLPRQAWTLGNKGRS